MSGNAIVYDGVWGETGEKLDVRYVAPIVGARNYWSALGMELGFAPVWTDRVAGLQMTTSSASQRPEVYESAFKVMRFNGVSQRMDVALPLNAPLTFFYVGRFANANIGDYAVSGGQSGGNFNLYVTVNNTFGFYGGSGINSGVTANTNNNIFIVTVNGANSSVRVNGTEVLGDLGSVTATAIRVGATSSGYTATDCHAMGIIPRALSSAERTQLHSNLKTQYNFS